jgi:hypothetical protein
MSGKRHLLKKDGPTFEGRKGTVDIASSVPDSRKEAVS